MRNIDVFFPLYRQASKGSTFEEEDFDDMAEDEPVAELNVWLPGLC